MAPLHQRHDLYPVGEVRPNVVWSLRHEALFYLVFALSFLGRRRMPWLLALWCAAPVLLWAAGIQPGNEWAGFIFNRANALFGCGAVVGLLYQRYGLRCRVPAPVGWALVCAGSLGAFAARDWLGDLAVAVAAILVLVAGLVTANSEQRFARGWELVGNASYSIYLTHNIFLLVGVTAWVKMLGRGMFPVAVAVLGTAAVLAGILVHLYVEKPVIRAARRLLSRSAAAPMSGGWGEAVSRSDRV
ncbi:acyltransferase family protein [Sinomonas flava]|uniref:acyltransferase family protein n=1 Tax=Sinomonas flava TaxID=496857 RepID=UPI0039A77430